MATIHIFSLVSRGGIHEAEPRSDWEYIHTDWYGTGNEPRIVTTVKGICAPGRAHLILTGSFARVIGTSSSGSLQYVCEKHFRGLPKSIKTYVTRLRQRQEFTTCGLRITDEHFREVLYEGVGSE